MRYKAPDDLMFIESPTADQLARIIRDSPHEYWQRGGNGEASLDAGPGLPSLSIKQPEPARFFMTFAKPLENWLVPYDGASCEELVRDERGGDPFWIPRACLISVHEAVEIVRHFLSHQAPWPGVLWRYWHELPLTDSYPRP
jgi:hypothetical protein